MIPGAMRNFFRYSFLFVLAGILLFVSCKREWDNHWDEKASLDPASWAPQEIRLSCGKLGVHNISWTKSLERVEGYVVDRKVGEEDWQIEYAVLPSDSVRFVDKNLPPECGLTYAYRVCAYAGENKSEALLDSIPVPDFAPVSVHVDKDSYKCFVITWVPKDMGEEAYVIDRKCGFDNWINSIVRVEAPATEFTDTNIFRNLSVDYRVYAVSGDYYSSKTMDQGYNSTQLLAPEILSCERTGLKSAEIKWKGRNGNSEMFVVETKISGQDEITIDTVFNAEYAVDDIPLGENITFSLKAILNGYESLEVEDNVGIFKPGLTDLILRQTHVDTVLMSWSCSYIDEEIGFIVGRKVDGEEFEILDTVAGHSYADKIPGLGIGVSYQAKIIVCGETGNFDNDHIIPQLPPPEITMQSSLLNFVSFSWDYSLSGIDGFYIDRQINDGSWQESYAVLAAEERSFTDDDVYLGTNCYSYRISARYQDYESDEDHVTFVFECGKNTLVDPRDDREYKTVEIAGRCWMAENLAYRSSGSKCYDDDDENCEKYGALYTWDQCMNYSQEPAAQGVCPDGWYVPRDDVEWVEVEGAADSQLDQYSQEWNNENGRGYDAGYNLKSTTGWENQGNGKDVIGFNALPAGSFNEAANRGYGQLGTATLWWTSDADNSMYAMYRSLEDDRDQVWRSRVWKTMGFSVRCVKNED